VIRVFVGQVAHEYPNATHFFVSNNGYLEVNRKIVFAPPGKPGILLPDQTETVAIFSSWDGVEKIEG